MTIDDTDLTTNKDVYITDNNRTVPWPLFTSITYPELDCWTKVMAAASSSSASSSGTHTSMLSNQFENRLMAFQREGIRFAVQCGGRCMIADEVSKSCSMRFTLLVACAYKLNTTMLHTHPTDGLRQDATSDWCDCSISGWSALLDRGAIISQILVGNRTREMDSHSGYTDQDGPL